MAEVDTPLVILFFAGHIVRADQVINGPSGATNCRSHVVANFHTFDVFANCLDHSK